MRFGVIFIAYLGFFLHKVLILLHYGGHTSFEFCKVQFVLSAKYNMQQLQTIIS